MPRLKRTLKMQKEVKKAFDIQMKNSIKIKKGKNKTLMNFAPHLSQAASDLGSGNAKNSINVIKMSTMYEI